MGIRQLRAHQLKPIQSLMAGQDTMVIAGTGSGKSIIYQLPTLLHKNELTLVIEPTLSLIYNQVKFLRDRKLDADYIDYSRNKKEVEDILRNVKKGKLTFLYVTPERLQHKAFQQALRDTKVHMVVVDECHCVTEWGYTFRDAYLQIGDFIDSLPKRPTVCACSATIAENRLDEIIRLLHLAKPELFRSDLKRKNLVLLKKDVTSGKRKLEDRIEKRVKQLDQYMRKYHKNGSAVVYALTTGYVDAIYNYLNELYPGQVARYHGQIKPESLRHKMELSFLQGKRKIMVATSAFGMGIDVPDVELVIHFHPPISMVDYIQQIGRAGRDQQTRACCVLFYEKNGDEEKIVRSLQKKAAKESKEWGDVLARNYDKTHELEMRHDVRAEDQILRLELRLERKRILQLAGDGTWQEQLETLCSERDKLVKQFLHRIRQDCDSVVTEKTALQRIENGPFREKTRKNLSRIVELAGRYESLEGVRKKMGIKKVPFKNLLDKFYRIGINPITRKEDCA